MSKARCIFFFHNWTLWRQLDNKTQTRKCVDCGLREVQDLND